MKKGDEMGKSASKPTAYYRRAADFPVALVPPVPPIDAPFWSVPGKGKTKRFCVCVGGNLSSDGGVSFTVKKVHNGTPSTMKSFTQGNWSANQTIEIGTDEIEVEDDDIFTMSISGISPAKLLPEFLCWVVVELGG
jgi:hypothetical protein